MALTPLRGQVARFNAQGFGFIVETGPTGGGEYFFHASNVSGADAPRAKTPGCNVEFEGRLTDKGRCATWVRVMEDQHPLITLPDSLDLDLGSDLSSLTLAGSAAMAPGPLNSHAHSYSTSPSHPITPPSPHGGGNSGLGWQHASHQLPIRREQQATVGHQRHAPLALQQYCTPLKVPLQQSAVHLELEAQQQQQQQILHQLAAAGLHQPPTSPMGSTALLSPTSLTPGLPMAVPPVAMHAQRQQQQHQLLQQQQQAIDARRYPQQAPQPPLQHAAMGGDGGGTSPLSQHKPTIMRPTRAPFPAPPPNQMGARDMHSPPFLSPHAQSPGYQQQHNIFATQAHVQQQQQYQQQQQHVSGGQHAASHSRQQQQQQPSNGGSLGSAYPSLQVASSPTMFHSMPNSLSDGVSFRAHDASSQQQLSSCDQQCATPPLPASGPHRTMMEQHSLSSGSSSVMSNGSGMVPQEGLASPCVPRKMVLAGQGGVASSMGHASIVNSSAASSAAPLMSIFCGCCGEPMRWDMLGERLCEVKAEADIHVLAQSMRGRTVFRTGDSACCPACQHRVQTNPRSAKCTHCQCVLHDFDPSNAKCTNGACDLARSCRDCREHHGVQSSAECGCPRLTTAIAGQMWGVGGEALQGFVILH